MEPTAFNLEQKELSTSQQITQHMKISQDEQKVTSFKFMSAKLKSVLYNPKANYCFLIC